MQQKIEITFPKELVRELEIFTKDEGITINEFIFWSIGEIIGEIRMRRGIKNHQQNQPKPDLQNNPKTYSPNQLLRAVEVAKYLDISKPEVYLLIRIGEIPVIRIGRLVRVKFSDLENFIETNRKLHTKKLLQSITFTITVYNAVQTYHKNPNTNIPSITIRR